MLFRKPNRRSKAARKSNSVPAIETVEDRLLLSAVSSLAMDRVDMADPGANTGDDTQAILTSLNATDTEVASTLASVSADSDEVLVGTDVVLNWNHVFGEVLVDSVANQNPGYASRSMAILNLAIYDTVAIAQGGASGETFYDYGINFRGAADNISTDVAASQAAYTVLSSLYPDQQATLDGFLNARLAAYRSDAQTAASLALGTEIGNQILAIRADDGWDTAVDYSYTDDAGSFQPDPLNPEVPVWGPGWGQLDTFAISSAEDYAPATTPALTSEEYAASYNEVQELGSADSTVRTADQTEAGLFWAYDREGLGTPLSLFSDVLESIAVQQGNTLEENAALFAQASVAMADSAVVAWNTKFSEEFWRPVTAIQYGDLDGNPLTAGDSEWTALGAPDGGDDQIGFTPQFPTYISGHATFGGALFGTLQEFYGTDDISFELTSQELEILLDNPELQEAYGLDLDDATRTFDSFSEAMAENGRSRVYLGIHFDFDDLVGQEVGQSVAASVASEFSVASSSDNSNRPGDNDKGPGRRKPGSKHNGGLGHNAGLGHGDEGDDSVSVGNGDVRTIDGSGNNLQNPELGTADTPLLRVTDAAYADGVSEPAGADRPSAREISNVLATDEGLISDRDLSAFVYVWGQFVDHDISRTPSGEESFDISVPTGDAYFDPFGTGTETISLNRSAYDSETGVDTAREQINAITTWLDGSVIYGSDDTTAVSLRTLSGGRLKTSDGDLLPYNNAEIFPDGTLPMDNDAGIVPDDELFAAGDVRANENIELTAIQTLFVREHNRLADQIAASDSTLTDEEVYQQARAIVIGELQVITYNEWLPAFLGEDALSEYTGYDSTVDPTIANEFSTAAFRFGHSLLGDDVEFLDNDGNEIAEEVPLSHAFSNPELVAENGIDSIIKYLASDPSSELDIQVVDSVRNFLFGPPGSGGLDLVSLNIQRGRDHGLADYNSTRVAYGLEPVESFADITSDPQMQSNLEQLYGSVDNIDLWVGGLAEDHVDGSSVGETFSAIITDQFERLRDGDRFWYQNAFSGATLDQIQQTRLADVIERNTDLTNLQEDVFFFDSSISGTVTSDTGGRGSSSTNRHRTSNGTTSDSWSAGVAGQVVQLVSDGEVIAETSTDSNGQYRFDVQDGLRTGEYEVHLISQATADAAAIQVQEVAITTGDVHLTRIDFSIDADDVNEERRRDQTPSRVDRKDAVAKADDSGRRGNDAVTARGGTQRQSSRTDRNAASSFDAERGATDRILDQLFGSADLTHVLSMRPDQRSR